MKIGAIIQARMGSTRLAGKVMKKIQGKTVLSHVIERVRQSEYIDDIIIATTIIEKDNVIQREAQKCSVNYFRGDEEDVLSRYYYAAKENNIDVIVRITSDCPLIDPKIIDEIVKFYLENNYDIVTNTNPDFDMCTYPNGLDTEVFSYEKLKTAFSNASEKYQKEHVTPYIYENSSNVYFYKNLIDYSKFRWTLDTEEDLELIKIIYGKLYKGVHNFYMDDIIDIFNKDPSIFKINANIKQKEIKGLGK